MSRTSYENGTGTDELYDQISDEVPTCRDPADITDENDIPADNGTDDPGTGYGAEIEELRKKIRSGENELESLPVRTLNEILRTETRDYLNDIMAADVPYPEPAVIERTLLSRTEAEIEGENANRIRHAEVVAGLKRDQRCLNMYESAERKHTPPDELPETLKQIRTGSGSNGRKPKPSAADKLRVPQRLDPAQIADIIAALYPVCTICTGGEDSDRDYDLLAIYQDSGLNEGTYVTDDDTFRALIRQYDYTATTRDINEVMNALRSRVPRKSRCTEKNLIAVNNGIFDYDTKELMPFDPRFIFLTKSHVNYNPDAENPVIHNNDDGTDWDVESWMSELSDDSEIVDLLWQILGAVIRPLVPWNKSAWLYSTTGNNGKGTLCELMRQLVGKGAYASIPLASLGQDFMLEPLTRASCIIVDENDVGGFIDKAANLKAIITNDVLQINRKFKTPIAYQFFGFMVQCLNEMPRIRDKSDSFFRRQLFIPFDRCFTGRERKYIKKDYIQRSDVLEYVLKRVLNMNYYTLSEPETCRLALEEYKEFNDPVRQFADDVLPYAVWDLLPFTFLHQMYLSWSRMTQPSGKPQNRSTFINDLLAILPDYPEWQCPDRKRQIRAKNMMDAPEPLLDSYGLTDWMNPLYVNNPKAKPSQRCTPVPGQFSGQRYRGLIRASAVTDDDDSD